MAVNTTEIPWQNSQETSPQIDSLEELAQHFEEEANKLENQQDAEKKRALAKKIRTSIETSRNTDKQLENLQKSLNDEEKSMLIEIENLTNNIKNQLSTLKSDVFPDAQKAVAWVIGGIATEVINEWKKEIDKQWGFMWMIGKFAYDWIDGNIKNIKSKIEAWGNFADKIQLSFFNSLLKAFSPLFKKFWVEIEEERDGERKSKKSKEKDIETEKEKSDIVMQTTWFFLIKKSKNKTEEENPIMWWIQDFQNRDAIKEQNEIDSLASTFFTYERINSQSFNSLTNFQVKPEELIANFWEKEKSAFQVFQKSLRENEEWIQNKIGLKIPNWKEVPLSEWVPQLWKITGIDKINKIKEAFKGFNTQNIANFDFESLFLKKDTEWNLSWLIAEEIDTVMQKYEIDEEIAKNILREFLLKNANQDIWAFRGIIQNKYPNNQKVLNFVNEIIGDKEWKKEWYQKTMLDFMDKLWFSEYKAHFWENWEDFKAKDVFYFFFLTQWEKNIDKLTEWTRITLYLLIFKTILRNDSGKVLAKLVETIEKEGQNNKYLKEISEHLGIIFRSWIENAISMGLNLGQQWLDWLWEYQKEHPAIWPIIIIIWFLGVKYGRTLVIWTAVTGAILKFIGAWIGIEAVWSMMNWWKQDSPDSSPPSTQ